MEFKSDKELFRMDKESVDKYFYELGRYVHQKGEFLPEKHFCDCCEDRFLYKLNTIELTIIWGDNFPNIRVSNKVCDDCIDKLGFVVTPKEGELRDACKTLTTNFSNILNKVFKINKQKCLEKQDNFKSQKSFCNCCGDKFPVTNKIEMKVSFRGSDFDIKSTINICNDCITELGFSIPKEEDGLDESYKLSKKIYLNFFNILKNVFKSGYSTTEFQENLNLTNKQKAIIKKQLLSKHNYDNRENTNIIENLINEFGVNKIKK